MCFIGVYDTEINEDLVKQNDKVLDHCDCGICSSCHLCFL